MTGLDLIESARLRVFRKHPYIGSVLMSLRLVEKPGIGTLAVDAGWRLYYDPAKCQEWGCEMLAGVVAHECWHVLRDHFHRMPSPAYDHTLGNIAMDLEINSDMEVAGWQLPKEGMFPKKFKFKNGLLAEEYYKLIQDKALQDSGVTAGKCGGCAGNAHEFEEGGENDGSSNNSGVKPLERCDQEIIRRQAALETAEHQRTCGDVPAGLAEWAGNELKPPTIDWRRQLAGLVRRAVTQAAGAVDHTWRKQSRRGAGLRHYLGEGCPILPALHRPVPSVGLILDVSGSMMGGPEEAARSEIMGVVRACGCELDVFVADVKVASKKKVSSSADVAKLGETLGGTDIGAAIKEVGAMRKHDILIALTDGFTPWHEPGDVRATVIVAVTPDGDAPPEWIKSVRMTK